MIVDTLAKQLMFSTTRIQTTGPRGSGSGTGFIYIIQGVGLTLPLLVTNKHVVQGAHQSRVRFIRSNAAGDGPDLKAQPVDVIYQGDGHKWTGHPDPDIDIAIMPLAQTFEDLGQRGVKIFFKAIGPELCPRPSDVAAMDAVEPITFIGYPNGLFDAAHNTPIIRQGSTATPIELDYDGKPTFLVDASVFPGSSGSPVFIAQEGVHRKKMALVVGSKIFFLGVIAAVMQQVITPQMIDLGIVFKWSTIEETVDYLCRETGVDRSRLNAVSPEPQSVHTGPIEAQSP